MIQHIIPQNDLETHDDTTTCKCSPSAIDDENGGFIVVHNAFDGRESLEIEYPFEVRQMLLTAQAANKGRPALKDENRGYFIRKDQVRAIVIHYTANKSATAEQNRNYFNRADKTRAASSHFIIDDREIIQCIPLNEVAYHAGGKSYTEYGHRLKLGHKSPNHTTIGIEICNNGDWEVAAAKAAALTAVLVDFFGLSVVDVCRHYDLTRKACPLPFVEDSEAWDAFLRTVENWRQENEKKALIMAHLKGINHWAEYPVILDDGGYVDVGCYTKGEFTLFDGMDIWQYWPFTVEIDGGEIILKPEKPTS